MRSVRARSRRHAACIVLLPVAVVRDCCFFLPSSFLVRCLFLLLFIVRAVVARMIARDAESMRRRPRRRDERRAREREINPPIAHGNHSHFIRTATIGENDTQQVEGGADCEGESAASEADSRCSPPLTVALSFSHSSFHCRLSIVDHQTVKHSSCLLV